MRVVRFSKPTHLDKHEFGTVIEVPMEDSRGNSKGIIASPVTFYYIQASEDPEDPQWIDIGQLLVSRLRHNFDELIFKIIQALKNNSRLELQ
jgi:hypothetical protein